MAIQSLLLTPKRFDLDDSGELKIDAGIRTCCEDRRLAIRSLSARLLRPLEDPRREEAVRFMAAETNEERKMIVHRIEGMVRKERELAFEKASDKSAIRKLCGRENPPEFRSSSWDLDRIYFYLLVQYFGVATLRWSDDKDASATGDHGELMEHDWLCAARDVEMEVERYRAKSKGRSLMPLTYALCAMVELQPERQDLPRVQDAVRSAITVVETELSGDVLESEAGRPIKLLLNVLKTQHTGGPSLGPGVPDAPAQPLVSDH